MANLFSAFQPNKTIISQRNFKNKNDLLFNNIEHDILNQDIYEITIQIDSSDRDVSVYPNPFDMKVSFNPSPDTYDKSTGQTFKGTPKPTIPNDFSCVKYIKLDSVVLPKNYCLKKKYDKDNEKLDIIKKMVWDYDPDKKLNNERYLLINIKEITNDSIYGTNCTMNSNFGTIYCDKIIGPDYYIGAPYGCIKIYKSSNLGNIKTWSIEITDSFGNIIQPVGFDKNCNTPKYCICSSSKFDNKQKEKCICKYVRHPLNPKFQIFMCFKIGVLINELNVSHLKN